MMRLLPTNAGNRRRKRCQSRIAGIFAIILPFWKQKDQEAALIKPLRLGANWRLSSRNETATCTGFI